MTCSLQHFETGKMIACTKANLADPKQASDMINMLDVYAKDIMGGGEALSERVKDTLASELIKRPHAHVFFATVDDQLAGLSICFEGFSTFECKSLLNIHDMVVSPLFRRRGVCTSLLFFIEHFANSIGCCKITLEVLEGNHPAKAAYSALGFGAYQLDPDAGDALFWQKKLTC